jgi:hypothetical protein
MAMMNAIIVGLENFSTGDCQTFCAGPEKKDYESPRIMNMECAYVIQLYSQKTNSTKL